MTGPDGIIGGRFPAAVLETHAGRRLDLAGVDAPAVVYFYPADNTPGCTREAEAFNRFRPGGRRATRPRFAWQSTAVMVASVSSGE
jgi:hypothetical protein